MALPELAAAREIMPSPLKVANIVAGPGERAEGKLTVGRMADGTPVSIPVALLNGRQDGPTVYLQAASDGDELNGIAVLHELLRQIDPTELNGRLIIVPLVNFHAFHARRSHSPVDGKKMNRCFPGKPDGSSSERIAHALFENAVRQADYCVDLHQGGVKPMVDEVRVRVGRDHERHPACLELARVFGIGFILDQQGPQGQLARAAPDIGIPTIDPELGGCHGWAPSSVAKGLQGVMNILYYYGLLPGEPVIPRSQIVIADFESFISQKGGFVQYRAELGRQLDKGEPIAEITDVFGRTCEVIEATQPCILWSHRVYPMVASGEWVCSAGINSRSL